MPVKYVEDIKIVRPFFNVISLDVLYLAYTSYANARLYEYLNQIKFVDNAYVKKAFKILMESPELMYSTSKSVELLQSFVISKPTRCRICGSFSDSDVCEYCRRFYEIIMKN